MSLLPDPATLRAIATRIGLQAEAARTRAAGLDAALGSISWRGAAAGAFQTMAHPVAGALRTSASDLDRAAQALRDLAANVGSVLDDLARAGVDVTAARDDIITALRDGADPDTLIHHPEVLGYDVIAVSKDGVRLLGDGVHLAGDFADGVESGVKNGVKSLGSLVGS